MCPALGLSDALGLVELASHHHYRVLSLRYTTTYASSSARGEREREGQEVGRSIDPEQLERR